jgi:hypothetical protein
MSFWSVSLSSYPKRTSWSRSSRNRIEANPLAHDVQQSKKQYEGLSLYRYWPLGSR